MRLAVLLALALSAAPLCAQAPAARYWIVLDAAQGAFVAAPPPSARALARRAQRGTGTPLADRTAAPAVREALAALGVEVALESRWLGALSAPLTAAQRAAVAALPVVREVRPVARVQTAAFAHGAPRADAGVAPLLPRPPDAGPSLAQLQAVGADVLLDQGLTGAGVAVGFLDTLFDFDHPAMAPIGAAGRLGGVQDFTGGQTQFNYHGLYTTSIGLGYAPGALIGPAHGATVFAATTEFAPTETHAEEDYFVAGLEWLESQGVDVVSISLGYSRFDPGEGDYTYADMDGDTTPFTRAADRAASLGVAVVASAGNEGASDWRYITAPADGDSVITVGATTPDGVRAGFSSVGPTADGRIKPDVAAQGTEVSFATPGGGYSVGGGTSFSAPMVAGVAAMLLQANPALTPMQLRDALRQTASQASAPDNDLGWGVVDAPAALALATAAAPPPGTPRWRLWPSVARAGAGVTAELPAAAALEVYDAVGRRVAQLPAAPAGRRALALPRLPAGVYLVRPVGADGLVPLRLVVVR